jgi:imidazolonepropionase-like amidohydrolase
VDGLTDEIRQAGVGVVVGPVRPQDQERQVLGLVALGQAGVPLAFSGDAAELRASAALLANAGLTRSTVRRALVGAGGDPLGLNGSTGRLQPGDAADFVVWTGDPLDTTSRTAAVIVQGKRVASEAVEAAPSAARGAENTPARPRTRGRNEP